MRGKPAIGIVMVCLIKNINIKHPIFRLLFLEEDMENEFKLTLNREHFICPNCGAWYSFDDEEFTDKTFKKLKEPFKCCGVKPKRMVRIED